MHPTKLRSTRLRSLAATLLAAGVCLLTTTSALFAKDDVTVKLTASKVALDKEGKEKLAAADEAKPGDLLQYEAVYRNESKAAVKGLEATVPIPAGLELLSDSAKPAGASASTDGKDFAAVPLMTKPAGAEAAIPVPLAAYRALRWTIPQLAPGATARVTLRARVLTNLPTKNTKP
jgi:uncharacterized repeat protein (TIGR01451 family)